MAGGWSRTRQPRFSTCEADIRSRKSSAFGLIATYGSGSSTEPRKPGTFPNAVLISRSESRLRTSNDSDGSENGGRFRLPVWPSNCSGPDRTPAVGLDGCYARVVVGTEHIL